MKRILMVWGLLAHIASAGLFGFYVEDPSGEDSIKIADQSVRLKAALGKSIDSLGIVYDVDSWFVRVFVSGEDLENLENRPMIFHTGKHPASEIRFRKLSGQQPRVRGQLRHSMYEISVRMASMADALMVCASLASKEKLPDTAFFAEDVWEEE